MALSATMPTPTSLLSSFRSWLTAKNYYDSTIRNYLADTKSFLDFATHQSVNNSCYSPQTVALYLDSLKSDPNYRRYLSSLSKFFHFSLDQNFTSKNPLKSALKPIKPSLEDFIVEYEAYLTKKRFSPTTIRNYLNDIRQFIDWSKSHLVSQNL